MAVATFTHTHTKVFILGGKAVAYAPSGPLNGTSSAKKKRYITGTGVYTDTGTV